MADAIGLLFEAFQYVDGEAVSLNSVPPTATLYGVEASPFTPYPWLAGWVLSAPALVAEYATSQPAEPLSPMATKTAIPSAAACCHRLP